MKEFDSLYDKRRKFYERHTKLAESIGFEKWQKNEFSFYCEKGKEESADKITELEKDKAYAEGQLDEQIQATLKLQKENIVLERRIERAKECIKKLLFIINSDPANYNCKGLIQDAEDFIYNRTCNIRQQGEHCISETRCIMCDK